MGKVKLPRLASQLKKEMRDVEKHSGDAEKLFTHFLELHVERERMRHVTHPTDPHAFKKMRRNIQREGTILKLLERDLEDVDDDLKDAIEGFKKTPRMVENDAIKELNFLKELIEAVIDNMKFLREKQKYYHKHKTSYGQLRQAIADNHDEEVNKLKKMADLIAPIRIKNIQEGADQAEKILHSCKHNKKKLQMYIESYRKQISVGRITSFVPGILYLIFFLGGLGDAFANEDVDYALGFKLLGGITAVGHFTLAALVGYNKIYKFFKKETPDVRMDMEV